MRFSVHRVSMEFLLSSLNTKVGIVHTLHFSFLFCSYACAPFECHILVLVTRAFQRCAEPHTFPSNAHLPNTPDAPNRTNKVTHLHHPLYLSGTMPWECYECTLVQEGSPSGTGPCIMCMHDNPLCVKVEVEDADASPSPAQPPKNVA